MNYLSLKAVVAYFVIIICQGTAYAVAATETVVNTQDEYAQAVKRAQPGDTIIMANGEWHDFEMVFAGMGSKDAPITLRAQTKGKVIITGQSNLRLAGDYLVVSGLVFKNGYTPTSAVISFRRNKQQLANHSRVTEVVIDNFNNPERFEADYWVAMYGKNNRFDHNHLEGKRNKGVTMAVRLDSEASRENRHRIDHNYFGPRPILGSNGGETLRIGTSHYSLSDSFTVVENNYFDRCDGELEIISVKSGGNVLRGNVFFESRGTLTMRHGNGNLIEDNVFLGNGVDHTGGIRVINKNQVIRNNYMEGLAGYRFGGALVIMNGVPNSSINRYHQVDNALIENNSLINSDHIQLAAGSDTERSAVPINSQFKNNLIYSDSGKAMITVYDDVSGIAFTDNVTAGVKPFAIESGFSEQNISLKANANGLKFPTDKNLAASGARSDLTAIAKTATGPDWYPKPDKASPFDSGKVLRIKPGEDVLINAIKQAGSGDIIEMLPGDYRVRKIIRVPVALTLRGVKTWSRKPVNISYERSTLFEIADGGSLKLSGLTISGKNAPDSSGNSVIRSSRYSMLQNYQLLIEDCTVSDLDVNHSFHFLTVSKSTFADRIDINNSRFSNVSGAILKLDKESDDFGIYNAEYVSIRQSEFSNIEGAIIDFYRGGTDESTFGPHYLLSESSLDQVGQGKRNKNASSMLLHGVQVTLIEGNHYRQSKPVKVAHTVGEPRTSIINNVFEATATPEVVELNSDLQDTAIIHSNTSKAGS